MIFSLQTRIPAAAWARVPRVAWPMTRAGGGCWWTGAGRCATRACSPRQSSHVSRVPAPPALCAQLPARVTCPGPGGAGGETHEEAHHRQHGRLHPVRWGWLEGPGVTWLTLHCPCLALLQSQAMRSLQHHENNKLRSIWVLGSKKCFLFDFRKLDVATCLFLSPPGS